MNDHTFNSWGTFTSPSMHSAPKRRRIGTGSAYDEVIAHQREPSKIDDKRVIASQALRLDCEFITIHIGQDEHKRIFHVHEDVICDASEFFRNNMKPEWASMRDDARVISLPDDDPDAFALYRTWIYSGKLAISPDVPFSADTANERDAHYSTLAYAYVLGERLLDIPFKNAIADVYVLNARGHDGMRSQYPTRDDIRTLYDGTGPGSPIRRLLVDIWVCRGKSEWLDEDDDILPREFLISTLRELLRLKKGADGKTESMSRPWKLTHEQYHDKRDSSTSLDLTQV